MAKQIEDTQPLINRIKDGKQALDELLEISRTQNFSLSDIDIDYLNNISKRESKLEDTDYKSEEILFRYALQPITFPTPELQGIQLAEQRLIELANKGNLPSQYQLVFWYEDGDKNNLAAHWFLRTGNTDNFYYPELISKEKLLKCVDKGWECAINAKIRMEMDEMQDDSLPENDQLNGKTEQ